MPKDMLVNEPTVEGQAKRNMVKFLAANGAGWRKKQRRGSDSKDPGPGS